MHLTDGLNPQQQQAMTAGIGQVIVLAGPGSGKTRVLTQRIAYLINHLGISPFNILAVTFTNKAAREIKDRVHTQLGQAPRGISLGTFHSICARILRREADYLPFDRNFVIFDQDDQKGLVKQAVRDLNIDEKMYRPNQIYNRISNAKNDMVLADDFPVNTYRDEVIQRVFTRYQALLLNSNAVDFDDLLLWTALLLNEHPEVRAKYSQQFQHILVDEFQDTNQAQYELIRHLSSTHNNIFVVGDSDQSIYRWRGADYRNILRFQRDYPTAQTILLEQNYRSTQTILDAAMSVIRPNPNRTHKELFTDRGQGEKIIVKEVFDGRDEGRFVIDTIAKLVAAGKADPGHVAIMYRINAQSRELEEAFLHANLPYKLVGAQRFYGRREVKDILSYLRLCHNTHDEASLLRVINTPRRKIGRKTIDTLRSQSRADDLNMSAVLLSITSQEDSPYIAAYSSAALKALYAFGEKLLRWHALASDASPLDLMDRIIVDVDYQSYLEDGTDEGIERWENVMELRRLAAEYKERLLVDFLEETALVSDQDTYNPSANAPTMLTLHASKGLEFPVVFIVGMEDGTLPHSRSFDDPEEMAEERRLLYVGITRAKDRLYLLHSLNRRRFGYTEPADISRYLNDIPHELIDGGRPSGIEYSLKKRKFEIQTRWKSEIKQPKPEPIAQFQAGDSISHSIFGEGEVLDSKLEDGDEIVEIIFEGGIKKRLIAALANLKKL